DGADSSTMLAVAFPHDQVQILPYNRVVKDLGGLTPDAFLRALGEAFDVAPGPATPVGRGEIAMYFAGEWRTLRSRANPTASDPIGSLDVSVLQDRLPAPGPKVPGPRAARRVSLR